MPAREILHTMMEFPVPNTEPIEAQLISDVIYSPDAIYDIQQFISQDSFSNDFMRKMWNILSDMYSNGDNIDITSVAFKVDFEEFKSRILPLTPSISSLSEHAISLRDAYFRRSAYMSAMQVLARVNDVTFDAQEMNDIHSRLMDGSSIDSVRKTRAINEVIDSLASNLQDTSVSKVPTGIELLDYITYGGLSGSWMTILAARPGVGKTAVAMHMARSASQRGMNVLYFSLEMAGEELVQRLMFSTGKVTALEFAKKQIDWNNFESAAAEIGNGHIYINDKDRTLRDIKATCKSMKAQGKCDAVFIDYLGLVKYKDDNRPLREVVTIITNEMKALASELKVPFVVLSQLNRASASEKRHPELYDLRDSGSIEQDADMVLMLENADENRIDEDDIAEPEHSEDEHRVNMFVRKFRHGVGHCKIKLIADRTYSNFRTYDETDTYVPSSSDGEFDDNGFEDDE